MSAMTLGLGILFPLTAYLYALSKRLQGPSQAFAANPNRANVTEDDLAGTSYEDIDLLKSIPAEPTHAGYAVVGGSGFLGT
jgi:hypothetical protein